MIDMADQHVWDAKHYDRKLAFVSRYGEDVFSLLNVKSHEHVLDLGCGSGHLTAKLAEQAAYVIGLDYSSAMVEQASKHYPHIRFMAADAQSFKLEEQVDAVFSNAALHWMKNEVGVIRSIKAALKDGGRFVAEFGGEGNVATIIHAIEEVLWEDYSIDAKLLNPWYFPSVAQYSSALESEGFYVKYVEHIDRPTAMEDGELGLSHWLDGFGSLYFVHLSAKQKQAAYHRIADKLRKKLFIDGTWYIDYKRLRVLAYKL